MKKIILCSVILNILYISSMLYAAEVHDVVQYHTLTNTSTFSISLPLPEDGVEDEVCLEVRRGNSTEGDPDMRYCSKSSIIGYRPDLCQFPVGNGFDFMWTFLFKNVPVDIAPQVELVDVYHTLLVSGITTFEEKGVYLTSDDRSEKPVCCGATVVHRLEVQTIDPIDWGKGAIKGDLEFTFYVTYHTSEVESYLTDSPCGEPIVNGQKTVADNSTFLTIAVDAATVKKLGWGNWYIVIKPKDLAAEPFEYSLHYDVEGVSYICPATETLGECDSHGTCDYATGKCKCLPCFVATAQACNIVETCSDHGNCNFTTGKCACHPGYNGDTCEFGSGLDIGTYNYGLSGGGAALLAIGMFILGSIAGVVALLVINKKIRRAVYEEVSIQDTHTISKAIS